MEELLTDRLRVLGPDHPHTLTTRHMLASWRGRAGEGRGSRLNQWPSSLARPRAGPTLESSPVPHAPTFSAPPTPCCSETPRPTLLRPRPGNRPDATRPGLSAYNLMCRSAYDLTCRSVSAS